MSDEKKPEAIVRRAFVPRRFPGHAFYDDFVKKLEAQFVDAGLVSRVRSKVPQGEEGVEMSADLFTELSRVINEASRRIARQENFAMNGRMRICGGTFNPPWRNGSTMNPTDPGEVNAESPPTDAVQNHIDLVTDDLIQGRTTPDQRRSLGKAVERADRVAPNTDRAFGRILGG